MRVIGMDGAVAGTVSDVWIDRAEPAPRYYEVALGAGDSVLLPATMARIAPLAAQDRVRIRYMPVIAPVDLTKTLKSGE